MYVGRYSGRHPGQNIGAVTSALNALQIDRETGTGSLDPLLQAQLDATKSLEALGQAFDKLSNQLVADLLPVIDKLSASISGFADFVGGLSTGQLIGLGVGGFAAYKALDWTGSAIFRRLIGGGLGRGFPPGVPGVPPAGFGGGPGMTIPGMRPIAPGSVPADDTTSVFVGDAGHGWAYLGTVSPLRRLPDQSIPLAGLPKPHTTSGRH